MILGCKSFVSNSFTSFLKKYEMTDHVVMSKFSWVFF